MEGCSGNPLVCDDLKLPSVKCKKANPDEQGSKILHKNTIDNSSGSRKKCRKVLETSPGCRPPKKLVSNFVSSNDSNMLESAQVTHEHPCYSKTENYVFNNRFYLNSSHNNSLDLILNSAKIPLISPIIIKNLVESGIERLFPIQNQLIPHILNGLKLKNDICVCAPTGSGKTLTYVIPILQTLSGRIVKRTRALIVVPTRELVFQITLVFQQISNQLPLKIQPLNKKELQDSPDVVITTPSALESQLLHSNSKLNLEHLKFLVLDEADKLLMSAYFDWLDLLMNAISQAKKTHQIQPFREKQHSHSTCSIISTTYNKVQKLLFSATQTHNPEKIASLNLSNPKYFEIISPDEKFSYVIPQTLTQYKLVCKQDEKPLILCHLVKKYVNSQILCFTTSVQSAYRINKLLKFMVFDSEMGAEFSIHEFSSTLSADRRIKILKKFNSNKKGLLICSDVMARGIDLKSLEVVINYDLPLHSKGYVHRVGRTGRAEKSGIVYTLVTSDEEQWFNDVILKKIKFSNQITLNVEDYQDEIQKRADAYTEALKQLKIHIQKHEKHYRFSSSIPLDTVNESEIEVLSSTFMNNFSKVWLNKIL